MFNQSQEQHEMILETIHPSGAEEWYCPTCGRRFLMQWPPAYNKVILNPGDESAIHSGGRGGASAGTPVTKPVEEQQYLQEEQHLTEEEQSSLQPWMEWMERVNFESLWQ